MICLSRLDQCRMTGDSINEVRAFLDEWMQCHTMMHRERITSRYTATELYNWLVEGNKIRPDDAAFICEGQLIKEHKEMYEFLEKKCHKTLRTYIRTLDLDPYRKCDTIQKCIAAIHDWVRIHDKHPALKTQGASKDVAKTFGAMERDDECRESTAGQVSAASSDSKQVHFPSSGQESQVRTYDPTA